jgi:hypothetical protein
MNDNEIAYEINLLERQYDILYKDGAPDEKLESFTNKIQEMRDELNARFENKFPIIVPLQEQNISSSSYSSSSEDIKTKVPVFGQDKEKLDIRSKVK